MQSDVKKIVETNCIDARSKLCSYRAAVLASYLRKESVREQRVAEKLRARSSRVLRPFCFTAKAQVSPRAQDSCPALVFAIEDNQRFQDGPFNRWERATVPGTNSESGQK